MTEQIGMWMCRAEAKLAQARETVTTVIQNTISADHARRALTEIEGKSK